MRGIPRLAVKRNLPVFGTKYRAQDIADALTVVIGGAPRCGLFKRGMGAVAVEPAIVAAIVLCAPVAAWRAGSRLIAFDGTDMVDGRR